MAVVQITDIVEPTVFTEYITQNTVEKTAFAESGVLVRNGAMVEQLHAGADSFHVPHWLDLASDEANIVDDDPAHVAVPKKVGTGKQVVRKSFLHQAWSAMNLASEMAGSDALARIQKRVTSYWDRQVQRRLISSLNGVLANNVLAAGSGGNDGDMLHDISALTSGNEKISAAAVIDAAATLGDALRDLTTIAMHSATYKALLKLDLIQTLPASSGGFIQVFRGLRIVVDDGLPVPGTGVYITVLFGAGAIGYGLTEPRIAAGTEIENLPSAGRGGGQQILHSRVNLAVHPLGFQWLEGTVSDVSPSIAELASATNWKRVIERKAVPLAFLKHKL